MKKRSEDKFYIYTIKGNYLLYRYEIIEDYEKIEDILDPYTKPTFAIRYSIDLRKPVESQYMINSFEKKDDNSLFYQIRKCIKAEENFAAEDIGNCLSKEIIYVDFGEVFRGIKEDDNTNTDKYLTYDKKRELDDKYSTVIPDDSAYGIPDGFDDYEPDEEERNRLEMEEYDFEPGPVSVRETLRNKQMRTYGKNVKREDFLPYSKKVTLSDRIRIMFEEGIVITFSDDTERNFVPFDKSQSMARSSRICFINKEILHDINERLSLGIGFKEMPLILSKYYAYKGLHLSSAMRIEHPELVLNEDTVVVLKDEEYESKTWLLSATDENHPDEYELVPENPYGEIELSEEKIKQVFDGEGLMSPKYAELINQALNMENKEAVCATSFQIRMPFAKGMLHQVDFHGFLHEFQDTSDNSAADNSEVKYEVEDYFGVKRNLFKAEIVLTESMFKGADWLSDWVNKVSEESNTKITDPMKFYFDNFKKYEHALYVSGTDIPYFNRSLIKLNYQFLNTLLLNKDDYEQLIKQHLTYADDIASYFKRISAVLSNDEIISESFFDAFSESPEMDKNTTDNIDENSADSIDEEDSLDMDYTDDEDPNTDSLTVYRTSNWQNALICNPNFIHDTYIKSKVDGTILKLKRDIGLGNLLTDGEIRYLSRDLLRFMTDILRLSNGVWEKIPDTDKLDDEHFYMPNSNINVSYESHYPIFRSPHLSRNEQCALRAYRPEAGSVRDRYFGHLKGILMVSCDSFVPYTLGGADFDGDIVKIIDNGIVRDAVLKGAYDMNPDAEYTPDETYNRRLPIIKIPSKDGKEYLPKDIAEYKIILDTFSNNIGRISNLAVQIGKQEYYTEGNPEYYPENNTAADTPDDKKPKKHYCAECTILTGLEIDACKSGAHPKLDDIFKDVKELKTDKSYDYIQDFKNPFLYYISKFYMFESKKYFTENISIPDKNELYGLNLLPYYYNEYSISAKRKTKGKPKPDSDTYYFNFEKDKQWKKTLDKELLKNTTEIIKVYQKIINYNNKVNRKHREMLNTNFKHFIYTIFSKQYSSYTEEVLYSGAYDMVRSFIKKSLNDSLSELEHAISRLEEGSDWPYLPSYEEKRVELARILGMEEITEYTMTENHLRLLTNFNNRGYRLLYLVLLDCRTDFADDYISIIDICKDDKEDISQANDLFRSAWEDLYGIYLENKKKKIPDNEIMRLLISKCNEAIQEQIDMNPQYTASDADDQEELKFKHIYQASKKAEYRDYFWSYYDFGTIKKYIYQVGK